MIARLWKGVVRFADTELITLSLWDSIDAIRAFAGDEIDAAAYTPTPGGITVLAPEDLDVLPHQF